MVERDDCTNSGSIFLVYPSEAVLHTNVLKGHTMGWGSFRLGHRRMRWLWMDAVFIMKKRFSVGILSFHAEQSSIGL
jgi:hypothetical protein